MEDIKEKLSICTQLRRVGTNDGLSVYDRSLKEWERGQGEGD